MNVMDGARSPCLDLTQPSKGDSKYGASMCPDTTAMPRLWMCGSVQSYVMTKTYLSLSSVDLKF